MLSFIARRLAIALPTLFLVVTLSFFLMRAAPGSPFDNGRRLTPEIERNVRARYGLDKPLTVQYAHYLGGVVTGDLGPSLKYQDKSVGALIAEGLPKSATIGLAALALALSVGVTLGLVAALRQNGAADYAATAVAVLGVCVPTFVTAPLLVLVFASWLGWLPTGGWGGIRNLVLPVIVLALPQTAIISRLVRAGMIETLRSNAIRTARAKGLPPSRIVLRHALPAAVVPLVAYLGPACAGLLTGSLVVEQLFGLPGIGRFFVISALQRDYPVVMGVVILYSALILLLNLAADLAQAALDPRISLA
ncbi:MAG: ABC transporter permease subunit [Sphingomonadaceae bacterium]|nr:ABC transporter permease subunit [Sphingomonadaceae bacterium]